MLATSTSPPKVSDGGRQDEAGFSILNNTTWYQGPLRVDNSDEDGDASPQPSRPSIQSAVTEKESSARDWSNGTQCISDDGQAEADNEEEEDNTEEFLRLRALAADHKYDTAIGLRALKEHTLGLEAVIGHLDPTPAQMRRSKSLGGSTLREEFSSSFLKKGMSSVMRRSTLSKSPSRSRMPGSPKVKIDDSNENSDRTKVFVGAQASGSPLMRSGSVIRGDFWDGSNGTPSVVHSQESQHSSQASDPWHGKHRDSEIASLLNEVRVGLEDPAERQPRATAAAARQKEDSSSSNLELQLPPSAILADAQRRRDSAASSAEYDSHWMRGTGDALGVPNRDKIRQSLSAHHTTSRETYRFRKRLQEAVEAARTAEESVPLTFRPASATLPSTDRAALSHPQRFVPPMQNSVLNPSAAATAIHRPTREAAVAQWASETTHHHNHHRSAGGTGHTGTNVVEDSCTSQRRSGDTRTHAKGYSLLGARARAASAGTSRTRVGYKPNIAPQFLKPPPPPTSAIDEDDQADHSRPDPPSVIRTCWAAYDPVMLQMKAEEGREDAIVREKAAEENTKHRIAKLREQQQRQLSALQEGDGDYRTMIGRFELRTAVIDAMLGKKEPVKTAAERRASLPKRASIW